MVGEESLDADAVEQREAAKAARAAYLATPEGKLETRAQQLSGDYGDVRQVDPKNIPAIENILKQIGTENVATKAIAATLAQKYGITNLGQLGTRQVDEQIYHPPVITQVQEGNSEITDAYYEKTGNKVNEYYNKENGQVIPQSFATYDDGKATYFFGLDQTPEGNLTFNQPREPNARAEGMKGELMMALALASLVFDWSGSTGYAILGAGDALAGATLAGEMAAGISAATGITVSANAIATGVGAAAVNTATTYARTGDIDTALAVGASSFVTGVGSAAASGTANAALTAANVNPVLTNYLSSAIGGATGTVLAGGSIDLSGVITGALATAASVGVTNAASPYVGIDVAKGLGAATQTYITTGNTDAAIQNGLFTGVGSALRGALQPKKSDYTQEQVNNGKYEQDLKNWSNVNPESAQAAGMGETTTQPQIGFASVDAYNKTVGEYQSLQREIGGKVDEYNNFVKSQVDPLRQKEQELYNQLKSKVDEQRDYYARYHSLTDPDANHWGDAVRMLTPEINKLKEDLAAFRQTAEPIYQQAETLKSAWQQPMGQLSGLEEKLNLQKQDFNANPSTTGVDANGALTYIPREWDISQMTKVASADNLTGIDYVDDRGVAHATLAPVTVTASLIDKFFEGAPDWLKQIVSTGAQGFGEQLTTFANAYSALTGTPFANSMANVGKNLSIWGANREGTDFAKQTSNFSADRKTAESLPWYDQPAYLVKSAIRNPLGFISEFGKERVQEVVPTVVGAVAGAAALYFGAPAVTALGFAAAGSALSDAFESFGSGAKEGYDNARRQGASEQSARNTGILNGAIHSLVTAPTEFLADKALFKSYTDGITKGIKGAIVQFGSGNLREFGQEFLETYAQGVSTALTTGQTIDPRALFAQAWTAGMIASGTQSQMATEGAIKDAVVAKDSSGKDVTLGEMTSGSKLIDPSTMKPDAVIGTSANGVKQTLGSAVLASRNLGMSTPELAQFMPESMLSNDLVIATLPGGTPVTMADLGRFEQSGGSAETFLSAMTSANPVTFASFISPEASATESQFATQTFFDNSVAAKIQAGASPLDATKSVLASMGIPASGVNLTALSQTLGGQSNAVSAVTAPAGSNILATGANTAATNANTVATDAITADTGNLTGGTNNLAVDTTTTGGSSANVSTTGNTAAVGGVDTSAVTGGVDNSAANTAATAVTNGVNTSAATNGAVTTAVNNGASTDAAVNGAVSGAVTTGADPNAAVNGAVTGATSVGADTNTAKTIATIAAANTAANNAETNVNANTNANTNSAVDANVNPNTNANTNANTNKRVIVDTNINPNTNANTDTATGTNANVNANSNTNANVNTNANTNVDTNANTNANVNTNTNANTNSNVNANTNANPNVNTNVNPNVNTIVNPNVDKIVNTNLSPDVNTNVNTNPNVNTNVNTNPNVDKIVNTNLSPDVNTIVNPNVDKIVNTNLSPDVNTNVNPNVNANFNQNVNTNVNPNVNENFNQNVNTNVNPNVNTNVNTNPNVNTNVNTNPNVNTNVNTNPNVNVPATSVPASNPALEALQAQVAAQNAALAQQNAILAQQAAAQKAAEEAQKAAADQAQTNASMQKAMQFMAPSGKPSSNNEIPAITAAIIGGKSAFVSPLEAFSRMVQGNQYVPQQQQQPEGALMQASPYAYGKQTDLNDIFGIGDENDGQVEQTAKAGGLMTPLMATGGTTRYGKFAGGGLNVVHHAGKMRVDFRRGDAVTGAGDGQSDDIPAMLADGEFVIPADVVAALGNGSTKAGSDALYKMMHSIRAHTRKAHPKSLPPPAKSPLDYISKRK